MRSINGTAGVLLGLLMALTGCQPQAPATPVVSPVARVDEMVAGEWQVLCEVDAKTRRRSCALSYLTGGPGPRGSVDFVRAQNGMLYMSAGPVRVCPDKPVMLRVDENESVTFERQGHFHLVLRGAVAERFAEQFRTGKRLVMRVYPLPECQAQDLTITLKGFPAAWKRFEAWSSGDST